MVESKTTIIRRKKIETILSILADLNYFIASYEKRNLCLIKSSDLKKVSLITTSWKDALMDYVKIASNSNTSSQDPHAAAETLKGTKKVKSYGSKE